VRAGPGGRGEVNHHILSHVNERTLQREVKALVQTEKIK